MRGLLASSVIGQEACAQTARFTKKDVGRIVDAVAMRLIAPDSQLSLVSRTDSTAIVRAHISWPDRGNATHQVDQAPTGRAMLVGASVGFALARSREGSWQIVSDGPYTVGD